MIDIVGTIYSPGTYDEEGNELTPPVAQEGYHVNVVELTPDLESYLIEPNTPSRVFAGSVTYCLRFTDRDEWLSLGYETTNEDGEQVIDDSQLIAIYKTRIKRQGMAVGPLQIRKALRATEQLSLVQEYMATASEEVKEAWDYASVFERTDSTVLEVQQVLNVSDDELDSLFELAATF